jgi:hypothetical protein
VISDSEFLTSAQFHAGYATYLLVACSSSLSLECVTDTLNSCSNGLFRSGAFDGESVGRGTGLSRLYTWYFLDGTDYGSLAMATMHILNTINGYIRIRWLVGGKLIEKLHHKSKYN